MANKIIKTIQEKCVLPELKNKITSVKGIVYEYDKETNTAKIGYTSPRSGGMIEMKNVHVAIESQGIKGASLKPDDEVLITFVDSEGTLPIVTKLLDRHYSYDTKAKSKHDRKGAFLPDILCTR